MKKKAFHLRFYIRQHTLKLKRDGRGGLYCSKSEELHSGMITYRGDTIAECVVKALAYPHTAYITSFTIRRGEGLGKNIKMVDYRASI